MKTPDFLLVGAAKSATTWLQRMLAHHPSIHMPTGEVHYFSRHYQKWTWAVYLERLGQNGKHRLGENSNTYLTDPAAAARIHKALPNSVIFALIRNPVDRAYSGYCMQMDRGRVKGNMDRELDPNNPALPSIISAGQYYDDLKRYYDLFPKNRIHLFTYDSILEDPEGVYSQITSVLDVEPFIPEDLRVRHNKKGRQQLPSILARAIWSLDQSPLASSRGYHAIRGVSGNLKRFIPGQRKREYPAMTDATAARLRDHYHEDILKTQALTGLDLSGWIAA